MSIDPAGTGLPAPPEVRPLTADERAERDRRRRLLLMEQAARAAVDRRAERAATASPYDVLGDALMHVISDRVFAAIAAPDFAQALRERGYTVVPAGLTTPPPPPEAWSHDAIDLHGAESTPVDLGALVDELWACAWQAGWDARGAAR